jgi:formate hydrogenlyase subunit 4
LSHVGSAFGVVGSLAALAVKFTSVACAVVVVETAQSRLRFYRYQELLATSFVFAILAIIGTQLV